MTKKLIQPLSTHKLEDIQVKAELESVGIIGVGKDHGKEVERLANDVMTLCAEIKRLRYTYGEPWWIPVDKTYDTIREERKRYAALRVSPDEFEKELKRSEEFNSQF